VVDPLVPSGVQSASRSGQNLVGYLRPPVVLNTSAGLYSVRQEPEPTPPPQPAPEATPEPTPEPQPVFYLYTVQPGDTVDAIAAVFGIGPEYILWNNPDVSDDPDLLLVGEQLQVPSVSGLIYTLKLGDTLSDVASLYQVDVQSVFAFVPNGIASPDSVSEGMVLLLPGAVPPPPPPPLPAAVTAVQGTAPPPPPPAPAASSGFIWPFRGAISQYFSGYHRGIDIDGFNSYGAPIVAAASGQVVLTAYLEWGLGFHVVVRHDDGSETVYAHLSEIYASQGQFVGQGDVLGALGSTGYSTGPHLHFEMHMGGVPVDPLLYLP